MKKENVITWMQFNNILPIAFTLVSITFSVAVFWYNIKLEISDVKSETKLTNQKLDQLTKLLSDYSLATRENADGLVAVTNRVVQLETSYKYFYNERE